MTWPSLTGRAMALAGCLALVQAGAVVPASAAGADPGARESLARAFAAAMRGGGELSRVARTAGPAQGSVTRWQQHALGHPVVGGQIVVAADASGTPRTVIAATTDPAAVDGTIAVSGRRAAAAAAVAPGATAPDGRSPDELRTSEPELVVVDPGLFPGVMAADGAHLAWRVVVRGAGHDGGAAAGTVIAEEVWIDARDGGVDLRQDLTPEAMDRRVCDANRTPAGVPCTSPARAEGDAATGIPEVDHAYAHAGGTYDLLHDVIGLDSYDGAGAPLRMTVRYCAGSCPYDNASWDGQQVITGEGYATDDIVAHEFAHGLTMATTPLVYAGQSGAINESISDIVGELADRRTPDAGPAWAIGEDTGDPFRDMADPTRFGDPDRMTSPLWATGPGDSWGVHTNSGVGNRFASLLVDGGTFNGLTVAGLGDDTVLRIVFGALQLLTPSATYPQLATAVRASCSALIGTAGVDEAACGQADVALQAVEMDTPAPGSTACGAPSCPTSVTAPAAPTLESVVWDGTGGLVVSFTAGADGGSPVTTVEYSLDSGSTWQPREPAGTGSPFTIPDIAAGRSYWVAIRLVNAVGAGARSSSATVTIPAPAALVPSEPVVAPTVPGVPDEPQAAVPPSVRALTVTRRGGLLRARWRLVADPATVAGVTVQSARRSAGGWGRWVTVRDGLPPSATSLRWRPARAGAAYRIRVRAVSTAGLVGTWSRPARG